MFRAIVLAALVLTLCACVRSSADPMEHWRVVDVDAAPVTLGADVVGGLRFRGGIALDADSSAFGGFSGLEVLEDGRFIAVSDNGVWFESRVVLDDSGALVGVGPMRFAYMRDERGIEFPTKTQGDAEDVAQLPDGRFAVSFEQRQVIRIYDLNRDGPFGAATMGPSLEGARGLPSNAGLEAIASTASGALVVGAEGGVRRSTPLWIAMPEAREPAPVAARYQPAPGFSLTALDRLPDGGFVALERFFAPIIGARIRITTFPEASLIGGDPMPDVRVLAEFDPPLSLDNFEALSAVRSPDGGVRLYVMSDDNYNRRQRTLIYAFDVSPRS